MIDLQNIWSDINAELEKSVTSVAYMLWFESLVPVCEKDNFLYVKAPSENALRSLKKNYLPVLDAAVKSTNCGFDGIRLVFGDEINDLVGDEVKNGEFIAVSEKAEKPVSPFNEKYSFDNFVVGESNRMAFYAAKTVAEKPGNNEGVLNLNPLFIYGGVGLGKTHLLHAIGNYILKNYPSKKLIYIPTEAFANEFYAAMERTSVDKNAYRNFMDKFNSVDVLMFDDVQYLKKKLGLQDALFHIFNTLYQNGKQIILSSDRPPKEIETIEDRVCSRFEGGLLTDIGMPTLDMRIAIIRKKMTLQRVFIPDDVVAFIAEHIDSNVRELEGALSKVILYSQLMNKLPPDIDTAKEALKVTEQKKEGMDINDIINTVCSFYRIERNDVLSKKKTKDINDARMVAIYLVCDLLSIPLVNIGQVFGGRDHTTIIHARDKIASKLPLDRKLEIQIKDIKAMLNA